MPAEVLVGVRVLPAKVDCQAPFWPAAAQAEPAAVTTDEPSSSRHRLAVRLFKVRAPVIVVAPFNLEVPKTPNVVEGLAVPTPTRFSLALTIKVLDSKSAISPP